MSDNIFIKVISLKGLEYRKLQHKGRSDQIRSALMIDYSVSEKSNLGEITDVCFWVKFFHVFRMATLADELLADLEDEEEDIEDELIAQESGLILELF